jgi:thiol-disulfide isomerase/thioredoxin
MKCPLGLSERVHPILWVVLLAGIAVAGGATPKSSTEPRGLPPPSVDQSPVISWKELRAYLVAPKDEVVVLDFWATWCVPCREALPDLAKVAGRYKDKHVRVVLVSFDDVEDAAAVREVVAKAGMVAGSFMLKAEDRTTLVKEIHPDWKAVVVPASFVYDTQGRQVHHKLFAVHSLKEWQAVLDPIIPDVAATQPESRKP